VPRPPARDLAALLSGRLGALPGLDLLRHEPGLGSNVWAVAGSKTANGRPLLASDPHWGATSPVQWYPVHLLVTGDPLHGPLNLSGSEHGGYPPGVVAWAQNQHLVWGVTTFFPDVFDVFADRLLRGDPSCPTRLCIDSAWRDAPVERARRPTD
jgi:penicillin amidase